MSAPNRFLLLRLVLIAATAAAIYAALIGWQWVYAWR